MSFSGSPLMVRGRRRGCLFHSSRTSTWLRCVWGLCEGGVTSSWPWDALPSNHHCRRIDDFSCASWGSSPPELVSKKKGRKSVGDLPHSSCCRALPPNARSP